MGYRKLFLGTHIQLTIVHHKIRSLKMKSENKSNGNKVFHLYETDKNGANLQSQEKQVLCPLDTNDGKLIMNLMNKFFNNNPKIGYIKFHVTSDSETLPMEKVQIRIIKFINDDFFVSKLLYPDINGYTEPCPLPTKSSRLTLNPNYMKAYATYDIIVEAPTSLPFQAHDIPIFENVTTITPINLIRIVNN